MKKKSYYVFKLDMMYLNIFSIFLLIILLLINHYIFNYNIFEKLLFDGSNWFRILFYYLLYAIMHEILHATSYVINGGKFNKVIFGVMLEKGILYCLCKQNITKKNILISVITPFILIGIITYFIGLIYDIPMLIFLSIVNMSGCAGDLVMFRYISKLKNNVQFSEFDDATSFAIYASYDVSKVKHPGLKYVGKKESIIRKDLSKFIISRFSIIFLIILFMLSYF